MTGCNLQHTKRFVLQLVGGATRFANLRWKFSKTQKSAADLCQILRMVAIKIVINSTRVMGVRVTISYWYCIAFEVMLLFLVDDAIDQRRTCLRARGHFEYSL